MRRGECFVVAAQPGASRKGEHARAGIRRPAKSLLLHTPRGEGTGRCMEIRLIFVLLGGRTVTVELEVSHYLNIIDRHLSEAVRRRWEHEFCPFGNYPHATRRGAYVTHLWRALCRAGVASAPAIGQGIFFEYPVRCSIEVFYKPTRRSYYLSSCFGRGVSSE